MDGFTVVHAKALYLKFLAIYDHKFIKPYHDDDFKALWANEWCLGLSDVNPRIITDALNYCRKNLDWPPSISEFVSICESFEGLPSFTNALNLATKQEFNHPVVLMSYEKVGSWAMKNDSELQLRDKFQKAYDESVNEFRKDKDANFKKLQAFNAKPKELPPPPKIPSTEERKTFKQMLSEYQQAVEEKKLTCKGKPYKEFDKALINPRHKDFDQKVYDEYREYLLSIPETETLILPTEYIYARIRFIGQREQPELLRQLGHRSEYTQDENVKNSPRNGGSRGYKDWNRD